MKISPYPWHLNNFYQPQQFQILSLGQEATTIWDFFQRAGLRESEGIELSVAEVVHGSKITRSDHYFSFEFVLIVLRKHQQSPSPFFSDFFFDFYSSLSVCVEETSTIQHSRFQKQGRQLEGIH
ncbi:hypothetical protein LINPERPRIM_LOCUS28148 [Linum perenne]